MKYKKIQLILFVLLIILSASCKKQRLAKELENNIYGKWSGLRTSETIYSNGDPSTNYDHFIQLDFKEDGSVTYLAPGDSLNYYWRTYEKEGRIYLTAEKNDIGYSQVQRFTIIESTMDYQLWRKKIVKNEGDQSESKTTLTWEFDRID
jgi:hypothetical protein